MSEASFDARLMARALELAARGRATTDPNPRVGCVLAHGGEIVGEGWHRRAGEPHAERIALAQAGAAARGACAYVTLEPCCHQGRTGPCSAALIAAGVAQVRCAMIDPNPLVAGQGLAALRAAGIAADSGLLEAEARALNPGFIKRMERGLPHVRCKLGASLDGRTALASGESQWITAPEARHDVQQLRATASAVLTGIGTVLADNPALNVRLAADEMAGMVPGEPLRQPLRVVLDSHWRMPPGARMLTLPGTTLVAGTDDAPQRMAALAAVGACLWRAPMADDGRVALIDLLRELARREVNELLVEAGPVLSGALLAAGLVDELIVYLAPRLLGDDARGMFRLPGIATLAQSVDLQFVEASHVGPDLRLRLRPVGAS